MNINDLTIGQAKELSSIFGRGKESGTLNGMIGKYVIIRTYSAGNWCGVLSEKSGNEVIITGARRMYQWKAKESITLSAIALHGIDESNSKIVQAVPSVWLEAIEIIPCSVIAEDQLKGAANVEAK